MDNQKTGNQTHNIILNTFLPSQQVKHLAYVRLDAPKSVCFKGKEVRLITGLVAATNNTVKLYSIYENQVAFQVGSWRMHEDIAGVAGWDRIIIVHTNNKVIGLRYEQGGLKNCFLLSLQFLPIDQQDICSLYADKMGYYLLIYIKNYIVLCFSQTLTGKYKARTIPKLNTQVISDEVKWNEPNKNYILDIVKIRLVDMQLSKIEHIQLMDQTIYFMGNTGKYYFMHVYYFFSNLQNTQAITQIPVKDQPISNGMVVIYHSKANLNRQPDFLYINPVTNKITLKSQQMTYDVATFQDTFQVITQSNSLFPILVWQKNRNKISVITKVKTFQENYQFRLKQFQGNYSAETMIFREGLVAYSSRTEVVLVNQNGEGEKIHHSIGNIIDFHIGRDMIFIENYENKLTRLYELTRGPKVGTKPFNTHSKKNFLEQELSGLISINTVIVGKNTQLLAIRRTINTSKVYTFYKEGNQKFQQVLEEVKSYEQVKFKDEYFVILRTKENNGKLVSSLQQGFHMQEFQWQGWKSSKQRWCINDYLISFEGKTWNFFNIFTKIEKTFQIGVERKDQHHLNSFIQFQKITKSVKEQNSAQIYLFYKELLVVWLINLQTQESDLVHRSYNLQQGSPILSNDILNPESHLKDKFRSITCPQYTLSQIKETSKTRSLVAVQLYQWQNKTLIILVVTDQNKETVIVYKKYFNIENGLFVFRRICTPLNVVKNFKWTNEKSFVDLGEGLVRFGNFLLYRGQILQSIAVRSLFRMEGSLWGLLTSGNIRQIQLGNEAYQGFCIRQIECGIKEQMMAIESTSQFYCVYSRKGFEVFTKEFTSQWRCTLGNENIVCLRLFEHYVGMSYYDYYCDENGVHDYNSVRFRFRIYNCATKNKIVERQKALDQPILHIRFLAPDKLILVTSSLIFINILKNDKTLELFRTHNFSSKRSFLSAFAYIPDIVASNPGGQGSPGYMLFGGSHGGLGFFVGKWIEDDKLKEQWFEGFRCGTRQISFFNFGEQRQELKALLADEDGNLIILTLKKDQASKIADIRIGSLVNSFKTKSGQQRAVYCSMSDGSIRLLTAVKLDNSEVSYLDFQNEFCRNLPFYGGFNLRISRKLLQKYRSQRLLSKGNVLDGDILQNFFSLSYSLQQHIIYESQFQFPTLKSILPF